MVARLRPSTSPCPDHPGGLARLFADVGASGVNIEDVRIDHDPGRSGWSSSTSRRAGRST